MNTTSEDSNSDIEITEEDKRILRNAELVRSMPDNIGAALAKARSKPAWCSDMRWRMELRRRKNKYFY